MEPLVSVGMPVYNGERYLRGAIDSLLSQDHTNLQLIISDNASIDATGEICREYSAFDSRVSYRRNQTNVGLAANCNLVSERAEGRYFMFAADDDLWEPSYVSRCLEELDEHPGAVLCSSDVTYIGETGRDYPVSRITNANVETVGFNVLERIHNFISKVPVFAFYGLMRKEALRATNMAQDIIFADVLLLFELALLGEFAKVSEQLFFYRYDKGKGTPYDRSTLDPMGPPERSVRPYTFVFPELLATVFASDLDDIAKNKVRADFVRVFTCQNTGWRHYLLPENDLPENMSARKIHDFIDSLLPML